MIIVVAGSVEQNKTGYDLKMLNMGAIKNTGIGHQPQQKRKSPFLKENLELIHSSGQLNNISVPNGYIKNSLRSRRFC